MGSCPSCPNQWSLISANPNNSFPQSNSDLIIQALSLTSFLSNAKVDREINLGWKLIVDLQEFVVECTEVKAYTIPFTMRPQGRHSLWYFGARVCCWNPQGGTLKLSLVLICPRCIYDIATGTAWDTSRQGFSQKGVQPSYGHPFLE